MVYCTTSSCLRERQREQVVRLLGESLTNSVTSVARDVVSKEAESICNSVNSMLKTLNGQLMHSVDEVNQFKISSIYDVFIISSALLPWMQIKSNKNQIAYELN